MSFMNLLNDETEIRAEAADDGSIVLRIDRDQWPSLGDRLAIELTGHDAEHLIRVAEKARVNQQRAKQEKDSSMLKAVIELGRQNLS